MVSKRKRDKEDEENATAAGNDADNQGGTAISVVSNVGGSVTMMLAELKAQMSMLQNEVVLQRQQNAEMKAQVSLLQTEVSTQRHQTAQISLLQSEVTTQRHNIAVLKAELDCLKSSPRQHGVDRSRQTQRISKRNAAAAVNNENSDKHDDDATTPTTPRRSTREAVRKETSDKGREFGDALVYLAKHNHFQEGLPLTTASIPKDYMNKNASKLKHCLAVADFVGDSTDVAVLQTEREDVDKLQLAASRIVALVSNALQEWDGKKTKGTSVLGLSDRIQAYRNRIKLAQGQPDNTKVGIVQLISLEELEKLENEQAIAMVKND